MLHALLLSSINFQHRARSNAMSRSNSNSPSHPNHADSQQLLPAAASKSTVPADNAASSPSIPARRVDHTYHDYSRHDPDYHDNTSSKKSASNFPAKLHQILSNPEYSRIICWMPHGRAWKILDKDRLTNDVIPQYFGQTKYESFTRQLSGWGFKRLHQSGPDFRCYYHEC